jgi:hypothetical protein
MTHNLTAQHKEFPQKIIAYCYECHHYSYGKCIIHNHSFDAKTNVCKQGIPKQQSQTLIKKGGRND